MANPEVSLDQINNHFLLISEKWFNTRSAAPALKQIVGLIAGYAGDSNAYGTARSRRDSLKRLTSTGQKFIEAYAHTDPITLLEIFGRPPGATALHETLTDDFKYAPPELSDEDIPLTSKFAASAKAVHGLAGKLADAAKSLQVKEDFDAFNLFVIRLHEFVQSADSLYNRIPKTNPGRSKTPDPLLFGVQCLASVWRKFAPDQPTNGFNRNKFGSFVEEILLPPPLSFPATGIRTAVRRFIKLEKSAKTAAGKIAK